MATQTKASSLVATPHVLRDGTVVCHNCGVKLVGVSRTGEDYAHDHPKNGGLQCKNVCLKEVSPAKRETDAYEVWITPIGTYYILKKWQTDDRKPHARWFVYCNGDLGDNYAAEIIEWGVRIK